MHAVPNCQRQQQEGEQARALARRNEPQENWTIRKLPDKKTRAGVWERPRRVGDRDAHQVAAGRRVRAGCLPAGAAAQSARWSVGRRRCGWPSAAVGPALGATAAAAGWRAAAAALWPAAALRPVGAAAGAAGPTTVPASGSGGPAAALRRQPGLCSASAARAASAGPVRPAALRLAALRAAGGHARDAGAAARFAGIRAGVP
eukprot:scaffold937_cov106-Isochrysis_galbana.AAC.2